MPGDDHDRLRGLDPWLVKDLEQRERFRRYAEARDIPLAKAAQEWYPDIDPFGRPQKEQRVKTPKDSSRVRA